MIAGKSHEAENPALRFSLAALFVVMTVVAALFASAGLKAIFLLPLLVAAGFLIALGRLIESRGWGGASIYVLRFAATGAAPWASGLAITVVLWLTVYSLCGYDDVLANSYFPRAAFPWLTPVLILTLAWFFSSRRWAYRGCWACPAVLLLLASPQWISGSIAHSTAAFSTQDFYDAGFAYLFAAGLFAAGLLGERHRNRRDEARPSRP